MGQPVFPLDALSASSLDQTPPLAAEFAPSERGIRPPLQPVASVRLERALLGLQDVEYLEAYSQRRGRAAALEVRAQSAPCFRVPGF
eukprot:1194362-Prorocentrum_minimum.AAC.1